MTKTIQAKITNKKEYGDCQDLTIRLFGKKYKFEVDSWIDIKVDINRRTIDQNNYYWKILGIVSDLVTKEYPEYTPTYIHDLLKQNILGIEHRTLTTPTGVIIRDYDFKSTTELDISGFIKYLDDVRLAIIYWFDIDIEIIMKRE